MKFSIWEHWDHEAWRHLSSPYLHSLVFLIFSPLIWSYLLNCKGSGHAAEKQKVMTGASSKRWDFTRLKGGGGGSRVLIMEQQLYSAEIVVELFCLSWRLVVVKHLRAKVLLFSSPFVSLCLSSSAQPWWLLLLMLSASFFLVVFSPNKPLLLLPETLNTSLPVHQSIFHQEDLPDFTKPWWGGYLWKRMSCQQTAVKGKSVMSTEQS